MLTFSFSKAFVSLFSEENLDYFQKTENEVQIL